MTTTQEAYYITIDNLCKEYHNQKTRESRLALIEVILIYDKKYEALSGKRWKDSEGNGITDYLIRDINQSKKEVQA